MLPLASVSVEDEARTSPPLDLVAILQRIRRQHYCTASAFLEDLACIRSQLPACVRSRYAAEGKVDADTMSVGIDEAAEKDMVELVVSVFSLLERGCAEWLDSEATVVKRIESGIQEEVEKSEGMGKLASFGIGDGAIDRRLESLGEGKSLANWSRYLHAHLTANGGEKKYSFDEDSTGVGLVVDWVGAPDLAELEAEADAAQSLLSLLLLRGGGLGEQGRDSVGVEWGWDSVESGGLGQEPWRDQGRLGSWLGEGTTLLEHHPQPQAERLANQHLPSASSSSSSTSSRRAVDRFAFGPFERDVDVGLADDETLLQLARLRDLSLRTIHIADRLGREHKSRIAASKETCAATLGMNELRVVNELRMANDALKWRMGQIARALSAGKNSLAALKGASENMELEAQRCVERTLAVKAEAKRMNAENSKIQAQILVLKQAAATSD